MINFIFQFLLFLLSFLISYAFLRKLKILPSTTNVIVAFIIALYFLSVVVFNPENIVEIIAYSVLFLFIAFILLLIYLGMKK
jgi:hypothetical protein